MTSSGTTAQEAAASKAFAFQEWRQRVGVEREYKWSFMLEEAPDHVAGHDIPEALRSIALPAGFLRRKPFRHTQATSYLDQDWLLLGREASLAVILNTGPTGTQAYLKAKQTVTWDGLRRDAVEIAERIDPGQVERAIAEEPVLPVRYLQRQFTGDLLPTPFATTEQDRAKVGVVSDNNVPLMISWDVCTIKAVKDGSVETAHCIEAETNAMEPAARDDLAALADAVSAYLGRNPDKYSKSRRAATLCGWKPS